MPKIPNYSYADASFQISDILKAENERGDLLPGGMTCFFTHKVQTRDAIVFLHGYTAGTAQFRALGELFFSHGYNVLIPRMPHHGLKDRMNQEVWGLTKVKLIQWAEQALDLAHGLGQRVTVMGLSGGGSATTWLAQNRSDLDLAVIISPFLGARIIPTPFSGVFRSLLLTLPDQARWWNPNLKDADPTSPEYAYPRYTTHALGNILSIGHEVKRSAKQNKPLAQKIIVVTNENDESVNKVAIDNLIRVWNRHKDIQLTTFNFVRSQNLLHDLITPGLPTSRTEIVYPKLLDLVLGAFIDR
jgi:carboxylesterase